MWLPTMAADATGDLKGRIGAKGMLDLRYTYYGRISSRMEMGLTLGAGVGYGSSAFKGTNQDEFTNTDYNGMQMDYTVSGEFRQKDRFAQADASLLLAMRWDHVTLAVGPRLMLPFAASRTMTIQQSTIDAYYPKYGVHVTNERITGYLPTPYSCKPTATLPKYNVLMALEIGYEWSLADKHLIGVQAYADVSVWNKKEDGGSVTDTIQPRPSSSNCHPLS